MSANCTLWTPRNKLPSGMKAAEGWGWEKSLIKWKSPDGCFVPWPSQLEARLGILRAGGEIGVSVGGWIMDG